MTEVHVLGVRHHGPGSARAVERALDALAPDVVMIEGAPELDAVAALAASPTMQPPVAGLVYVVDEPRRAAFYPLASFSPEWRALRWALSAGARVQFADLPAANALARVDEPLEAPADEGEEIRDDPIAVLAYTAGYDDPERWWEDAVEHRAHGLGVFEVVLDAMRALRAGESDGVHATREAAMRRALRREIRGDARTIAFVCGAWHAPVLVPDAFPSVASDDALLKGLPKTKVAATWAPWTSSRLAYASGYGAGVRSPGWYEHLFTTPEEQVNSRWLVRTATALRAEQLDASSASVIEAERLADALAAVRGRPVAGIEELLDATQAVLCNGSDVPMRIIARRLLVGDLLGHVPDGTPMVPLARDLVRLQARLRMKRSAVSHAIELDLRNDTHLERSRLLYRLLLLDVPWGEPIETGRTRGTFKEAWRVEWRPELEVALIEASAAGTTIVAAATDTARNRAAAAADLRTLTDLVEQCLLAGLDEALDAVIDVLAGRAAQQHDTTRLMDAVEPLGRVRRYGSVRRHDTEVVHSVLASVMTRVAIGLPSACAALDDDAATAMRDRIDGVQRAVGLVDDADIREGWQTALATVVAQRGVHGLVAGRATRLLLDTGRLDGAGARRRLSLALSPGTSPTDAAGWVEGFVAGDALLLLHDHALLAVIDEWLCGVPASTFDDTLPLVRRAFADFAAPERRMIGEQVRHLEAGTSVTGGRDDDIDDARGTKALARVLDILGISQ
jgi:hypothetical protein